MEDQENRTETIFKPIKNGPMHVMGRFVLKDSDNNIIGTEEETFLCRCGHSKNKPFCDGSHKAAGFTG